MIIFTAKNGKEIRQGDILQGKHSYPVLVVFDEANQEYRVVIVKAKTETTIYGLELNANIEYGFTSFSVDEFVEAHPDFQVLFNLVTVNLSKCSRKPGEKFTDEYQLR